MTESEAVRYDGVIARYGKLLDLPAYARTITLLEGDTPLIPMPRLAEELGGGFGLWVKFEGLNPTGSFKDRGMTVAISEAVGRGVETVICASTGNTAASAAAYAARAGLHAVVLIPQGKVAVGKLAGAIAYGAEVLQIDGSFDDALDLVLEISQRYPIALVNSLNPYRLEGQKTAAFEICGRPVFRGLGGDSFTVAGRRIDFALHRREVTHVTATDSARATHGEWTLTADTISMDVASRKVT